MYQGKNIHEKEDHEDQMFFDDITGAHLDTQGVLPARQELQWLHRAKAYEKRTIEECWQKTGKGPITLKWIDRNKGDREHPNYRSRIVVREVKKQHGALPGHMLFSSMPPLEAVKILCSELATRKKNKKGKDLRLALYDVLSRAHLYGEARREIYVTLPPGDEQEGYGAILKKTMYGTQDASHVWQEDYSNHLKRKHFHQGQAWTSVFRHGELDIKLLVHGGDFLVIVDQEGQEYMQQVLKEKYEYRCDGEIGKGSGKHLTILNRIVSYEQETGRVTYRSRSKTC